MTVSTTTSATEFAWHAMSMRFVRARTTGFILALGGCILAACEERQRVTLHAEPGHVTRAVVGDLIFDIRGYVFEHPKRSPARRPNVIGWLPRGYSERLRNREKQFDKTKAFSHITIYNDDIHDNLLLAENANIKTDTMPFSVQSIVFWRHPDSKNNARIRLAGDRVSDFCAMMAADAIPKCDQNCDFSFNGSDYRFYQRKLFGYPVLAKIFGRQIDGDVSYSYSAFMSRDVIISMNAIGPPTEIDKIVDQFFPLIERRLTSWIINQDNLLNGQPINLLCKEFLSTGK
jgi:hypothetical protein